MENKKVNVKVTGCGTSIAGILTVVFVIAKILNLVAWSWWICFLPLIISLGLGVVIALLAFIIGIIASIID